jgi:hypothetical protein
MRRYLRHLQNKPEEVRYRIAGYATIVGGLVIGLVWLTVLLPWQLRQTGAQSGVAGVQDMAVATPSPLPSPTPTLPAGLDFTN